MAGSPPASAASSPHATSPSPSGSTLPSAAPPSAGLPRPDGTAPPQEGGETALLHDGGPVRRWKAAATDLPPRVEARLALAAPRLPRLARRVADLVAGRRLAADVPRRYVDACMQLGANTLGAASPDKRRFAVWLPNGVLELMGAQLRWPSYAQLALGEAAAVAPALRRMQWSPDSRFLALADALGTVSVLSHHGALVVQIPARPALRRWLNPLLRPVSALVWPPPACHLGHSEAHAAAALTSAASGSAAAESTGGRVFSFAGKLYTHECLVVMADGAVVAALLNHTTLTLFERTSSAVPAPVVLSRDAGVPGQAIWMHERRLGPSGILDAVLLPSTAETTELALSVPYLDTTQPHDAAPCPHAATPAITCPPLGHLVRFRLVATASWYEPVTDDDDAARVLHALPDAMEHPAPPSPAAASPSGLTEAERKRSYASVRLSPDHDLVAALNFDQEIVVQALDRAHPAMWMVDRDRLGALLGLATPLPLVQFSWWSSRVVAALTAAGSWVLLRLGPQGAIACERLHPLRDAVAPPYERLDVIPNSTFVLTSLTAAAAATAPELVASAGARPGAVVPARGLGATLAGLAASLRPAMAAWGRGNAGPAPLVDLAQPPSLWRPRPMRLLEVTLHAFEALSPAMALQIQIHDGQYDVAMALCETYGLDTDVVYQHLWNTRREINAETLALLDKIKNTRWVYHALLTKVADDAHQQVEMIRYGLALSRGVTLASVEAAVSRVLDGDSKSPRSPPNSGKQSDADDEAVLEITVLRRELLTLQDRLETHEAIYAGAFLERGPDAWRAHFEVFRYQSLIKKSFEYAARENFRALEIVMTRHAEVLPYRFAILESIPESSPIDNYEGLLPRLLGDRERPFLNIPWRRKDWSDDDLVTELLHCLETEASGADPVRRPDTTPPDGIQPTPELADAEALAAWYMARAAAIESAAGQVRIALKLLEFAQDHGIVVPPDHVAQYRLLAHLVYAPLSHDHPLVDLTMAALQAMPDGEKLMQAVLCTDDPEAAFRAFALPPTGLPLGAAGLVAFFTQLGNTRPHVCFQLLPLITDAEQRADIVLAMLQGSTSVNVAFLWQLYGLLNEAYHHTEALQTALQGIRILDVLAKYAPRDVSMATLPALLADPAKQVHLIQSAMLTHSRVSVLQIQSDVQELQALGFGQSASVQADVSRRVLAAACRQQDWAAIERLTQLRHLARRDIDAVMVEASNELIDMAEPASSDAALQQTTALLQRFAMLFESRGLPAGPAIGRQRQLLRAIRLLLDAKLPSQEDAHARMMPFQMRLHRDPIALFRHIMHHRPKLAHDLSAVQTLMAGLGMPSSARRAVYAILVTRALASRDTQTAMTLGRLVLQQGDADDEHDADADPAATAGNPRRSIGPTFRPLHVAADDENVVAAIHQLAQLPMWTAAERAALLGFCVVHDTELALLPPLLAAWRHAALALPGMDGPVPALGPAAMPSEHDQIALQTVDLILDPHFDHLKQVLHGLAPRADQAPLALRYTLIAVVAQHAAAAGRAVPLDLASLSLDDVVEAVGAALGDASAPIAASAANGDASVSVAALLAEAQAACAAWIQRVTTQDRHDALQTHARPLGLDVQQLLADPHGALVSAASDPWLTETATASLQTVARLVAVPLSVVPTARLQSLVDAMADLDDGDAIDAAYRAFTAVHDQYQADLPVDTALCDLYRACHISVSRVSLRHPTYVALAKRMLGWPARLVEPDAAAALESRVRLLEKLERFRYGLVPTMRDLVQGATSALVLATAHAILANARPGDDTVLQLARKLAGGFAHVAPAPGLSDPPRERAPVTPDALIPRYVDELVSALRATTLGACAPQADRITARPGHFTEHAMTDAVHVAITVASQDAARSRLDGMQFLLQAIANALRLRVAPYADDDAAEDIAAFDTLLASVLALCLPLEPRVELVAAAQRLVPARDAVWATRARQLAFLQSAAALCSESEIIRLDALALLAPSEVPTAFVKLLLGFLGDGMAISECRALVDHAAPWHQSLACDAHEPQDTMARLLQAAYLVCGWQSGPEALDHVLATLGDDEDRGTAAPIAMLRALVEHGRRTWPKPVAASVAQRLVADPSLVAAYGLKDILMRVAMAEPDPHKPTLAWFRQRLALNADEAASVQSVRLAPFVRAVVDDARVVVTDDVFASAASVAAFFAEHIAPAMQSEPQIHAAAAVVQALDDPEPVAAPFILAALAVPDVASATASTRGHHDATAVWTRYAAAVAWRLDGLGLDEAAWRARVDPLVRNTLAARVQAADAGRRRGAECSRLLYEVLVGAPDVAVAPLADALADALARAPADATACELLRWLLVSRGYGRAVPVAPGCPPPPLGPAAQFLHIVQRLASAPDPPAADGRGAAAAETTAQILTDAGVAACQLLGMDAAETRHYALAPAALQRLLDHAQTQSLLAAVDTHDHVHDPGAGAQGGRRGAGAAAASASLWDRTWYALLQTTTIGSRATERGPRRRFEQLDALVMAEAARAQIQLDSLMQLARPAF